MLPTQRMRWACVARPSRRRCARRGGRVDPSLPLAGEVLTVKACFDFAGWTTHAGSAVLADAPPAGADAPMVAALRSAGAIVLAQTNMTEFAYGALGLNSTYGKPTTPMSSR